MFSLRSDDVHILRCSSSAHAEVVARGFGILWNARPMKGRSLVSILARLLFWLGVLATLAGFVLVVWVGVVAGRTPVVPLHRVMSVGLALATGGLGDRAFNDSAYAGLQRAQAAFGTRFRVVEWKGGSLQVDNLRDLAQEGHDLVLAVGQENATALKQVAAEYPEQHFAIIDAEVAAPNVTSITFRELEGDFLAGALTALLSPGGTVGFLGGADVPVIRRIEYGWRQGVLYINPQAKILVEYAGGKDDFSGFTKPDVGFALAQKMYQQGATVVYAAAGGTVLGAIAAAREQHQLMITTGTDQRWIAPENVVTSRTKNMDTAIVTLLGELQSGGIRNGTRVLDLAAGGVGLAPLDGSGFSSGPVFQLDAPLREQLAVLEHDLMARKIVVPEFRP